jgi:hypothetical protein
MVLASMAFCPRQNMNSSWALELRTAQYVALLKLATIEMKLSLVQFAKNEGTLLETKQS